MLGQIHAILLISGFFPLMSPAATWLGNTSVNWNDAANWGGSLPTIGGDTAVFGAAGTAGTTLNNDITGQTLTSMTFNSGAPAWTLGGNLVTLTGGVTNSSTSLQTINFGISTTAVRTFTMTTGGGNIALGGNISGSGGGVTLAGTGTLTLSGNNSYSGNTTIDTGTTLNINSATAIGTGTLAAIGTAILDNTSAAAITLTNNNNINLSGGSLTFTGTKDLSFGTGVVTISGANRTITTTAGTLTIGSINSATTSLTFTKSGTGTLIITGAAGANLQAQTSLSGTVGVGNNTSLGTGNILLNSGLIFQAVNNDVTMANTGNFQSFTISGSQNLTFTNKLTGSTGNSRTLTSSVSVGKTLTLGVVDINEQVGTARTLTLAGTGNTSIGTIANGTGTNTANGLTITNTGLTTLTAANTYTGTTTVTAGAVRLNNANALPGGVATAGGTSALLFNGSGSTGGVIVLTAATGDFTRAIGNTAPTATQVGWSSGGTGGFSAFGGDRNVNFGGASAGVTWSSTGGVLGGGLILSDSASDSTITVVNPIALNAATRTFIVNNGTAAVDAIVSGVISGTGSAIIKSGAGTLALTATNTYGSASVANTTFTTISGGTLQIGNGGTTGSLTTNSNAIVIQNDATLAFNRSNALTMQYVIQGTGAVNQIGTGTTTLSGTNTYGGGTNVNTGGLTFMNTNARPSTGTTTVAAGATLGLGVATAGSFFTSTDVDSLFAGTLTNVTNDATSIVGIDTTAGNFTYATSVAPTTRGLTKLGSNTLSLTGANAYSGITTVSAGVLRLDNANALSGGVAATGGTSALLFNGGVIGLTTATGDFTRSIVGLNPGVNQVGWTNLGLGGFAAFGGDRIVNFGGASTPTTITWSGSGGVLGGGLILGDSTADSTVTVLNPISLNNANSNRTVTVNDGAANVDAILAGVISSTSTRFIKAGTGTLAFTAANTYVPQAGSAGTTISAGTLQFGNGGTTGSVGATSGDISITAGATLAFNRSNALAVSNNIIAGGAVNQIGIGTTTLSGTNTYTGGTNVNIGGLTFLNTNARPSTGTTTVAAGATLGLGVATAGSFFTSTDIDSLFAGALTNVTNSATSNVGIDTTAGDFTYATSVASTTRGLTKMGSNTLSLTGANAYTGPTTISAGVLRLDNANALPGGVATTGGTSNLTMNGGILGLTAASGDFTRGIGNGADQVRWITDSVSGFAAFGGDRTVNFGGSVTPSTVTWSNTNGVIGDGLILSDSTSDSTITIANPISLSNAASNRPVTVNNGSAAVDAVMAGVISSQTTANNGTRLIKNGTGTLALTAANTYVSGSSFDGTTISGGTLQLGNGGTTGSILYIPTVTGIDSDVTISSGATFAFNRSNALTVANLITGAGAVTQRGTGTTTLTAANTYSGTTSVTNGTLLLNNTTGSGTGTGAVNTSNSTILGGTGTISPTGANSVTIGGTVAPGASGAAGTLNFTPVDGNVTFQNTSGIAFELFGNGSNDKIVFNASGSGVLDFSAMANGSIVVTFAGGYTPALGHSFNLLDWAAVSGPVVSGLSSSQLNLSTIGFDPSWAWDTTQFVSDGIITVVVPEPARSLFLVIGMLAFVFRRRRTSHVG